MSRSIKAFRLGNFKAFADTQRIPIKPITLIFGPNSAGKSSFIHSLAFAHEAQSAKPQAGISRFDIHHTKIGGSAIDLGGFRQYLHRGQLNKHVEWGVELDITSDLERLGRYSYALDLFDFDGGLESLRLSGLDGSKPISVNFSIGIDLDDKDRQVRDAIPVIKALEIAMDGVELIRLSQRTKSSPTALTGRHRRRLAIGANYRRHRFGQEDSRPDSVVHQGDLRVDRVAVEHPLFLSMWKRTAEQTLKGESFGEEELQVVLEAFIQLLPTLVVPVFEFFPTAVYALDAHGRARRYFRSENRDGSRASKIADAACEALLTLMGFLLERLADVLSGEFRKLGYLGPLRSFPARHLSLGQPEDANWFAGGASAWDVVRRNTEVRDAVNVWLSSSKLKTPYKLVVRPLVAIGAMKEILETRLEEIEKAELEINPGDFPADIYPSAYPKLGLPQLKDPEQSLEKTLSALLEQANANTSELVLEDQRTRTVVTHRDVGIGISQVLPVLVMAFGSNKKMLAMEQPEIHLHPALQAELGDVFIESALGERQNTFILETHSEHLILRLMRRMRETHEGKATGLPPITPDDIAVLYVEPDGSRSIVREMPLNEMGELVKSWPGGFFEEGLREQFGDD
jgi:hypothetical protein